MRIPRLTPRGRVLAFLVTASYVVSLLQRPGETVADTRLELSVDPGLFLARVTHLWSATTDLGHVQSGQFNGYLFPMGPWFAGGDALGLPMWLLQRLWLGTLLAFAAWGVVRMLDELMPRRPIAQLGAGLLFIFNPYVVQFASRGTVALIAYAALPWLMVAAHRGARRPTGWRWPAAAALILAASGGGVNAALIGFMLIGPAALLTYDAVTRELRWRAVWSFTWRAGLLAVLASLWWIVPVLVQSGYGADFLSFTEQPGTIWGTSSASEGLRQLGFWGLYVGSGFGSQTPFFSTAPDYLFNPLVILGSFGVPLVAFAGLRAARAWRYAAFFGLLAALTIVVMSAGYPEGTPLRQALNFAYAHVPAGRFLRTTYKAAPLLVLCFACLGGAAAAALVERARSGALRLRGREFPAWAPGALVIVPLLAALPLVRGTAIDRAQVYHVPPAWPRALDKATASAGADGRTMILPGEISAWYRWGGTVDPVGPALESRPVAIREVVPYADQRSAQLQTVVDDLVQQDRLAPGQLGALLRLMGVRQVVVPTDSVRKRSGALDPVSAAVALSRQPEFARFAEQFGPVHLFKPRRGRSGPRTVLPELRRYPVADTPGMVRVEPEEGATVVAGDADGVAALAGLGALAPSRPLFYGADVSPSTLRRLVASGARIVFTDSGRRRAVVSSRTRLNRGPTLTESVVLGSGFTHYAPFGERRGEQTVAVYSTLRKLYAPALPAFNQFPERRAYAVFDGRRDTTWISDPVQDPDKRYVEASLRHPLSVPYIEVFPHVDARGGTTRVEVTFNGGHRRTLPVSPAGTRVPVPVPQLRSLRVRIAKTQHTGGKRVSGGLDEVRVPGLRVSEWLRLPNALAEAARPLDLSRNELDVVLERTTADFPRRVGRRVAPVQDEDPIDAVDAEAGIERQVDLPVGRSFTASGWASVAATAPDDAIDRLTGIPPAWRMRSSSRFEGVPSRRASSSFDRDPGSAWVGDLRAPWIAWRSPRPLTLRRLTVAPGPKDYERPTSVRITAPGTGTRTARVGPGGRIDLSAPLRSRSFRLDVLATTHGSRLPAVAVGEIRASGLHAPMPRRTGSFRTPCGALSLRAVGAADSPLVVLGSVRDLDARAALRMRSCGPPLRLPRGPTLVSAPPGTVMRVDRLLLRAPAPQPTPAAATSAGRVLSISGHGPAGVPEHARLDVRRPGWLVFAQSWSRGWRATCRTESGETRDLGTPMPIDGFANGWRVTPGCVDAAFSFKPQRAAIAASLVSAIALLAAIAIAMVGWRRDRRREARPTGRQELAPAGAGEPLLKLGWRDAILVSAAVGVVTGFVFALRAGAVLAPVSLLAVRYGVGPRRLLRLSLLAVALLPIAYLAFLPDDRRGFSFSYATDLQGAHWVAVFAVVCMGAASALMVAAWRRSRLDSMDHAVPGDELTQERDPHEEGEARPVARLD